MVEKNHEEIQQIDVNDADYYDPKAIEQEPTHANDFLVVLPFISAAAITVCYWTGSLLSPLFSNSNAVDFTGKTFVGATSFATLAILSEMTFGKKGVIFNYENFSVGEVGDHIYEQYVSTPSKRLYDIIAFNYSNDDDLVASTGLVSQESNHIV